MKKFVEVRIGPSAEARCVTSTGEYDVAEVLLEVHDGKSVEIGFVSRHLHRRVHAGGVIPLEAMDKLAEEWIRMRSGSKKTDGSVLEKLRLAKRRIEEAESDIGEALEELS